MKLCHGTDNLEERPSNGHARLFTCNECGQLWSWTEAAGWFQQGRPRSANAKRTVVTKRVTDREHKDIKSGKAEVMIRYLGEE